MILKTAWKNVWRNKTRSMVVIAAITIGIFAGVYSVALMNGMILQRVDSVLNTQICHIQINHKDFRNNKDIQNTIPNTDEVIEKLNSISGISAISKRCVVTGMVNSTAKNAGVQISGINPNEEKKVLSLFEKVIPETGSFFEEKRKSNIALIGESMAKELNLIRYSINELVLDSMKNQEVPNSVVKKLAVFSNKRFKNEKLFFKEIKSVLSEDEQNEFGQIIINTSKKLRKRANIVITFLDKKNNQTGASFKIAGLYNIDNNMFEKTELFVLNSDLKPLIDFTQNEYHQILIRINDINKTDEVLQQIKTTLPDLEVLSWKEIQPDLALANEYVTQIYFVFMLIILAALTFGIINTMLMVVLERTKELGMLAAIGMNKKRVFSMIMLESVFLSLIGGFFGMIIGNISILISAKTGVDFSSYAKGFEEIGYSAIIYPKIDNSFFVLVTGMIIITGIISAIYPAIKALKLNPADAIRTD